MDANNFVTTDAERDARGRFVNGVKPGPGRPKGSRNLLTTKFVNDAYASWQKHGPLCFERMALSDPSGYCRLMSTLIPREALLNVDVDIDLRASLVVRSFRHALEVLGAEEPPLIETSDGED